MLKLCFHIVWAMHFSKARTFPASVVFLFFKVLQAFEYQGLPLAVSGSGLVVLVGGWSVSWLLLMLKQRLLRVSCHP